MTWAVFLGISALTILLGGCVSKSQANARAQAAFFAGQQQGMARAQQIQSSGGNITIMGAVRNNQVPWTTGLTLANALISADYIGQSEPKEIIINRGGQQMQIDPKQLLSGQDIPLESRDVIEIR
jgi:hypothetical protein